MDGDLRGVLTLLTSAGLWAIACLPGKRRKSRELNCVEMGCRAGSGCENRERACRHLRLRALVRRILFL